MNPIEYTKIRILSMGNSIDESVLDDLLVELYNEGVDDGRLDDEESGYGEQVAFLERDLDDEDLE